MKSQFRHGVMALALCSGFIAGGASAQIGSTPPTIQDGTIGRGDPTASQLRLSETQKSAIAEAVRRENKAIEPIPSFAVQIGAAVPPAIELHMLPDSVLASVPATKTVKYTVVRNQLVLVDPTTMRVVEIIPE